MTLVRVARGVWRDHDQVADFPGGVSALLAACPPGSVVAGTAAAQLHGLWLPRQHVGRLDVVVRPDLALGRDRWATPRAEIRARRVRLRTADVTDVGGVPVMSPARTWLDLAARLRTADVVAVGDSVLRLGASTDELAELISTARRCPGVVRARATLPLLDGRSESRPESHLRYLIVSAGLPAPIPNVDIVSDTGEWLCRPDLHYDDVPLALEYNGRDHAKIDRTRRDITRVVDVEDRGGWRFLTFGAREVFSVPDVVIRRVRRVRAELAAAGARPPVEW